MVLTCKHHDGFCLWPSQYTEHSVKHSPWKDGQGDMVREISDACRRHGLKFGVYLSPWDRNHKDYGRPEYLTYYRNQLRELLTNYGPIFEMWFDGANGGDGYYGGARERRNIDNRTYYDWDNTWKIVRELQPDACMFSDAGPDVRWVGNEVGLRRPRPAGPRSRGPTCGRATPIRRPEPGRPGRQGLAARRSGRLDSPRLVLSRLAGRQGEDAGATAGDLFQLRGPRREPDPEPPARPPRDHPRKRCPSLREWRRILDATFAQDLARGAKATASHTRGNDPRFAPGRVVDGKRETYWATDDAVTTAELVLDLGRPVTFNVVRVREYLPLGQRVDSFAVDGWDDGKWQEIAAETSIGNQRLVRTRDVTTAKVRLRITQAAACPAISEVSLFAMPGK